MDTAQQLATASGTPRSQDLAIKKRDLVPWPKTSPKVRRERIDRATRLFRVFDALRGLAESGMTPGEFIDQCPATSRYRVDAHLEGALAWLTELADEWERS